MIKSKWVNWNMIIRNTIKNTMLTEDCRIADSFFSRFMGLMGKKTLKQGAGLLITPCNSIHMLFMRFPIDAVFLGSGNEAVHIIKGMKPWRLSPIIRKAHSVLELPEGTVESSLTEVGDRLELMKFVK